MHTRWQHKLEEEEEEEDTVPIQEPVGCYSHEALDHIFVQRMEKPCNVGWAELTSLAH